MKKIRLRMMDRRDIPEIARIHANVLPTVTGRLGAESLERFYTVLLDSPNVHSVTVAESENGILGAISLTRDAAITSKLLAPLMRHPKTLGAVLRALIVGRVRINELIERVLTEKDIARHGPSPYQTILTLVVRKDTQRMGIGSQLLERVERLIPQGQNLFVDTEKKNTAAQSFYGRHGFRLLYAVRGSVVFSKTIGAKTPSQD